MAVRFGTDYLFNVAKDGEIILDCYEVDCLLGVAWRYTTPFALCSSCGRGVEAYVDHGTFTAWR